MTPIKATSCAAARRLWCENQKLRFLVVGGWNTLFGYLCFYVLYQFLAASLHYLFIATAAHFISVIQSYITQRCWVFESHDPIAREFLRFNLSHLGTLLFGLMGMSLLVEMAMLPPTAAQAIIIATSVTLSYLLHSRISFIRPATRRSDATLGKSPTKGH